MRWIVIGREEERQLELRGKAESWQKIGLISTAELDGIEKPSWRVSRIWTRIVFFVLGCLATLMLFGLLNLMQLPKGYITAIAAIGLAEFLIQKKLFLRTGIEESLYISGLCAFIFGLPGEGKPEAIFLFAAAFAIAGSRLANAIFLAIGCLFFVLYIEIKTAEESPTGVVAFGFFVLFAVLHRRVNARPFVSWTCAILVAVLFPLSLLLIFAEGSDKVDLFSAFAALILAATVTGFALRKRWRALWLAGFVAMIVPGGILYERLALEQEWKLILAGISVLAVSLAANRFLRGRKAGLTSDRLVAIEHADVVEMAAGATLTPATAVSEHTGSQGAAEVRESEGAFGGAGSSGEY